MASKALASRHLLSSQAKEEEEKSFDMPPSWVTQIEITPEGLCHSPVPSPREFYGHNSAERPQRLPEPSSPPLSTPHQLCAQSLTPSGTQLNC